MKVLQTDVAGNVSSADSLTFTLDRAKPVTPTLALTADTGKSATDRITSNGALTISGKETGNDAQLHRRWRHGVGNLQPEHACQWHAYSEGPPDRRGRQCFLRRQPYLPRWTRAVPTVTSVTTSGPDISRGSGTLTTARPHGFSIALSEAVTITDASKLVLLLSNGEAGRL